MHASFRINRACNANDKRMLEASVAPEHSAKMVATSILLALIASALLLLLLMASLWQATHWQRHGIRGPGGWPLVGSMLHFCLGRRHYGDVYKDIYNAHPDLPWIGIYRIFNEPAVLVRSQELLKEVMIRSFQHFQDNVLYIDPQRDPIIWCNPFVAKGEKWRHMRAELVPIFTPNKVKSSFPHIKSICAKLETHVAENLNQKDGFEVKDLFSKFTLDVVASAAYGLDAETFSNTRSDFTQLVEHLFQPNALSLVETIALLFSPTLGNLIQYHFVPPGVQHWLRTIIGRVLDKRLAGNNTAFGTSASSASSSPSDFVQWLIEAKQKLQEPPDAATIVGHCSTFLLEGFETSSSLMAFALYEYATNPTVQARVLQEIDAVLARFEGVLCHEALQEMPYFEASLFETLRLYPPMMALLKHCTKPFELPPQRPGDRSYAVPEGMVFVVPVKAVHYDAELYPEPHKFQPERFLAQNERQRLGCAFLGFGEGPRMCPGMRFGLAQSKAGLVTLLSKYRVHLADRAKLPLKLATTTFLTAAKNGIWISFRPRKPYSS